MRNFGGLLTLFYMYSFCWISMYEFEYIYKYIYNRETAAFGGVSLDLRGTKPDLQVTVCETLGAESVDLWPARYFQKSN